MIPRLIRGEYDSQFLPYAQLLLRAGLAAMWLSHALLKVMVYTLPGAAKFFDSVGLPGFLVYPVVAAEIAGALFILLGFYGRFASLLLMPILITATWVHAPNGWVFSNSGGGWEYPVFLALASIVHFLIGDGHFRFNQSPLRSMPAGA